MEERLPPICHLNLAPTFRGGERQVELLIRELASRGREQVLVVRNGSSLADRCADVERLEIRCVASNPVAAGLAVRGSSIAHAHDARTVYSALLARLLFGIPYIITRRVVAPQSKSWLRSAAYRRAAQIAAVSVAAAVELRKRHPEQEALVIPDAHAGFVANDNEVRRIRAAREGKILIGHMGALEHSHKGQSTIIDAARMSADRYPDWHFLLCGVGNDEALFREQIGDLTNIELVGWVDNVGDYLEALDVFVYPSLHEALGSILLDAMQFGLPIVASNVDGIPDIVEDGVNGHLVEPENAEQLLEGIRAILADTSGRREMGSLNREKAGLYGSARMADSYETVYREIDDPM
jgi:glycosyltransferase involved in cell wall biosynthesis